MTATDELRRLLDGRGIEYYPKAADKTVFSTGTEHVHVQDDLIDGCLELFIRPVTPQQAVEATLGRGTCHDLVETPEYRDKTEFKCSECGYEYSAVGGFGCDCGDAPDFRYCPNCGRKVVDA